MSRRVLLSLLCLLVLLPLLVHTTRARAELRVNETKIRILLQKNPIDVLLPVENPTGEVRSATVQIELLDPRNKIAANVTQLRKIERGKQILTFSLPFNLAKLKEEDSQLPWYRLHYRMKLDELRTGNIVEGFVSLSEITPDLFMRCALQLADSF